MDRLKRRKLNQHRARCGKYFHDTKKPLRGWAAIQTYLISNGKTASLPRFSPKSGHFWPLDEAMRRAKNIKLWKGKGEAAGWSEGIVLHIGPKGQRLLPTSQPAPSRKT